MTYYLYKKPDGYPDVSTYELKIELFQGYQLISISDEKPDVYGKRFNDANELIDANPTPEYVRNRKLAYPTAGDQLDMLWHAMDDGLIPKIEPMYSDIKAVKEAYPKPSN